MDPSWCLDSTIRMNSTSCHTSATNSEPTSSLKYQRFKMLFHLYIYIYSLTGFQHRMTPCSSASGCSTLQHRMTLITEHLVTLLSGCSTCVTARNDSITEGPLFVTLAGGCITAQNDSSLLRVPHLVTVWVQIRYYATVVS